MFVYDLFDQNNEFLATVTLKKVGDMGGIEDICKDLSVRGRTVTMIESSTSEGFVEDSLEFGASEETEVEEESSEY